MNADVSVLSRTSIRDSSVVARMHDWLSHAVSRELSGNRCDRSRPYQARSKAAMYPDVLDP